VSVLSGEVAVLCLVTLGAARAAFVLRRRQFVAARISRPALSPRWRLGVPGPIVHRLKACGLDATPAVLGGAVGAWMVTVVIGALVAGKGLAGIVAVAVPVAMVVWGRINASRTARRYGAELPAALEEVARGLRTGTSLVGALHDAAALTGPVAADLTLVVSEASTVGLTTALDAWAARRPTPAVRLAVASLVMGIDTGGAQAAAIDGTAAGLRQRLTVAADLRAAGAQARLSGIVIAFAPVAFAVVASASDPQFRAYLFGTGNGIVLLTLGLVLDGAGAAWMARLTREPA
jgi:tight adherence protein B